MEPSIDVEPRRASSAARQASGTARHARVTALGSGPAQASSPGGLLGTLSRDVLPRLKARHVAEALVSDTDLPDEYYREWREVLPASPTGETDGGASAREVSGSRVRPRSTRRTNAAVSRLAFAITQTGQHWERVLDEQRTAFDGEELRDELLVPCARRLGEMWVADEASLVDVTIGVARLEHALARTALPARKQRGRAPSVLLMPAPGETHTFGLKVLADELCRAGWRTRMLSRAQPRAIQRALAGPVPDVIGIGVSGTALAPSTPALVATIRLACLAPTPLIVAGGPSAWAARRALADAGIDEVIEPPKRGAAAGPGAVVEWLHAKLAERAGEARASHRIISSGRGGG